MVIAKQSARQWVVASETRPDTLYVVKLVNGYYSCDCMGHYSHGHCKHARAVAAMQPSAPVDQTKIEMAKRLGILA